MTATDDNYCDLVGIGTTIISASNSIFIFTRLIKRFNF